MVKSVVDLEIGGRFFHSLIRVKTLHSVSKYNSAPWVAMVNPSAYWGQERKVAMSIFFVYLLGIRCQGRWVGKDLVMTDPIKCCLDMTCACVLSCFGCVCFFATVWTVAHQAPLSMGFSRQEYWSELPFPSPGDLPDLRIEPMSPVSQANSSPTQSPGKPVLTRPTRIKSPQSVSLNLEGRRELLMWPLSWSIPTSLAFSGWSFLSFAKL